MANKIKYQVGFDVKQNDLNKLKASLQQLKNLSLSDLMKINDSDMQQATRIFIQIRREAQKVQDAIKRAFNAKLNTVNIETFNKSLQEADTSIEKIYNTFKKGGTAGENAFRSLSSEVLTTNAQLKETHKFLDNIATTLSNTVKWNVASSAVNALSQSVQQAWGYVKNLDTSLNDIRIVTGKSADEMANFAVQANEAAQSLGRTTTDYTKAALIYAQQGLNDEEIAARAALTLKTANVTGQSTSQVSEQLTAVWNGYKVDAEEAELYIDRLAAVAATTASDLEELSKGMSKVASAAAAMGVGEDQLAAQLSTIISVTRQAPESVGTALRTVYARISDIKAGIDEDGVTLGRYSGKMAELGFNVLDVAGNLRDMGEVMEEIGGKWATLTREQQINLAQTMAGQRQYSNLIALFDNFDKYTSALNTAQNAAGTLQKQQSTYLESTAAHLNQLKAATENLYDSLLNPDSLEPLMDGLSKVINFTSTFVDSLGGGASILGSLGAIGITVFSEQIAKGINTTITNFEIAKSNAAQFEQVLQQIQQWQGIPGLDQLTKYLLQYREQLVELSSVMSPEQFSGMQTLLNNLTATSNALITLSNQKEILDKVIESVLTYKDAWKTAEDVINDPQGQEEVLKRLKEQENALNNIIVIINEYSSNFKKINTKILNGEDIAKEVAEAKKHIQSYIDKLSQLGAKGQLADSHVDQLEKIKIQLSTLKDSIPDSEVAGKLQIINGQLKGLATNAENIAIETRKKIETNFVEGMNSIDAEVDKHIQKLQQEEEQLNGDLANARRTKTIENYTKITGGIAQMGAAIQQIQHLGSIWKNDDLSTGQKILQTVTNLSMSLPLLTSGLTKTATAMGLLKVVTTDAAIAETVANANTVAYIGGLQIMKTAAGQTAIAIEGLNTILKISPWTFAVAGAAALVAILASVASSAKEANEQLIKFNQTQIDDQNKKQQQINKNEELLVSVQKLNQEYQNGQIKTRAELRSEIDKLIDQYGIEENYIDKLIDRYGSLAAGIRQARIEAEKQKLESLQVEQQATYTSIVPTAKKTAASTQFGNYLTTAFGGYTNQDKKLIDALSDAGYNYQSGNSLVKEVSNNPEEVIKLYKDTVQAVNNANLTLDEKQTVFAQKVLTWISQMGTIIDQQQALRKDIEESELNFAIRKNLNYDFSKVSSLDQYQRQRETLITNLLKTESANRDTIINAVDNELKTFYSDLYNKYSETTEYYDKLISKFGKENSENILIALSQLDEAHLSALKQFDLKSINNWEDLAKIISQISTIDLSNLEDIPSDTNVDVVADKYNFYQSLEDQIKSGKSISKTTFKDLEPELQSYFSKMANGSYKLTEDAEAFYNKVNSLKLQGFFDSINAINKEIEKNQQLSEYISSYNRYEGPKITGNTFNFDQLNKIAASGKGRQTPTLDYDLINQQLDYLSVVSKTDEVLQAQIDTWKKLAKEQGLQYSSVVAIAEEIKKAGDQTDNLTEKATELKEALAEAQHQLYDALFPLDADLDETAVAQMTRTLQQMAPETDELANGLENNARAADALAEAILRFDNAIQDVVDHYDDWKLALQQDNLALNDQAIILPQLRDAYADMLNLDGSLLSNEFLLSAENLQLMKAAIDGDIEAYDQLAWAARVAAIETLKVNPEIDMSHFDQDLQYLTNYLNNRENFPDLEIGAQLNDEKFLAELSAMLNKMGVSAQQASDILRENLGIDAQIIEVKDNVKQKQEYPTTEVVMQPVDRTGYVDVPVSTGGGIKTTRVPLKQRAWSTSYVPKTETVETTKQGAGFALKVTSAHKSAGGNFKYTNASRGAGSAGVARRQAAAEKAAKAAKTSEPKEDTSTKEVKNPMQDDRDIYHDINIELSQIGRDLERVQKQQDRLYGKQLIDNLLKQSQILEQHKTKLKEKLALQKQDLANQKANLQLLGATFDEEGKISNYMDLLGGGQGAVNNAIAAYNGLVSQYNATTNKEAKDALKDQLTESQRQVKAVEDSYKKVVDAIKDYDSLRDDMEDIIDQIETETQKQIEIQITKFRMQVEIRLEMGEAARDWNKFKREVLEGANDILNDSSFDTLLKNAQLNYNNVFSYFDVNNTKGSIQKLTEQLNDTRQELEAINSLGSSAIYGDNKAQAMADLQSDLTTLMGQMEDVQGLVEDIDQAYLDTIDDIKDQFDEQIEDYEFVGELIEHDIDLLSLLYGEKNYGAMDSYYAKLHSNQLLQADSLKQQAAYWKNLWDTATDENDAKKFKKNYEDTIKSLNSLIEQSVKTLQDKYINAVNQIFDTLDKKMTGGMGTSYLEMEWQLMKKNADEYLDTINSAFAIQELEIKYQKAINSTDNVRNQKVLTQLMDEQLSNLRAKEKLTQYDVDRAQKLLQIEQARLALEDTQKSKTSLRLRRDTQGNYSYEYVSNEEDVAAAQEELLKAQNDLYNFDKQAYRNNLEDMLAAWRDFQTQYKDIILDTTLTEEERIERLKLLEQQYGEYINNKTEENLVIRNNLTESAFADYAALYEGSYEDYMAMIQGEKDALMSELVPEWTSSIQLMTDAFVAEGGFIPACEEGFAELEEATYEYQLALDDLEEAAGKDFDSLKQGIDNTADAFQDLIIKNDELIAKMSEQMSAIQNLRAELKTLLDAYNNVWEAAKKAAEAANQALQKERAQAAQATAAAARETTPAITPTTPTYTTPVTQTVATTPVATAPTGSGTGNTGGASSFTKGSSIWNEASGTAKGIAGNIYYNGSWSKIKDLRAGLEKVFAESNPKAVERLYSEITAIINSDDKYRLPTFTTPDNFKEIYDYYEMIKKYRKGTGTSGEKYSGISTFDSGGYTGAWGSEGKLAWLHQKELVLNADDTKNMLDSVAILRGIVQKIGGNITSRLNGLNGGFKNNVNNSDTLEQNVNINATFPNVNSKREIEEAFNDLVNLAAQRAMRQ